MKKGILIASFLGIVATILALSFQNNCRVDQEFKETFYRNLTILEDYTKGFEGDDTAKAIDAISYLNAITKIRGNMYLGDVVYYEKKVFKKDASKWKEWYKNNKCEMTISKADSLYRLNAHLRPNHSRTE